MNPRRTLCAMAVLACLAIVSTAQVSSPNAAGDDGPTWDRYRVLVERNIFLRSRTKPQPPSTSREVVRVVRDPDADWVLIGTVRQGSVAAAFIENIATGEVHRAVVNDAVGTGRITTINLDGVTYSRNETNTPIAIGQNLNGAAPSAASEAPTLSGGGQDTAAQPSDNDTAAILERMRRQRQQELNQ